MNLKSNKAITLVALIITIIILLILAGVSLSMVLGNNGLINKAQSSVDKYQQSATNEQAMLNSIEDYFKEYMPGESMPLPDGWDGTKVTAVSDGKHNVIPVPKDFVYVGGNLNNGVIISDNPADQYDGTVDKTTWEYTTNLVGNQFVWIPCTEAEYVKTEWGSTYQWGDCWDRSNNPSDVVKRQLQTYRGFYVARYEAGLATTIPEFADEKVLSSGSNSPGYNTAGIPQSKAGKVPWNFINYANSKANAESMYNTSYVQSGLITGTQWDVMLNKILGTTNENGITFTKSDLTDSNKWGNFASNSINYTGRLAETDFSNGFNKSYMYSFGIHSTGFTTLNSRELLTTGASKTTESYHLYDIAGNVCEWTDERGEHENYHEQRGDSFVGTGTSCRRAGLNPDGYQHTTVGYRVVLYIK